MHVECLARKPEGKILLWTSRYIQQDNKRPLATVQWLGEQSLCCRRGVICSRHLFLSKRRPHSKTRDSLEGTKIYPWFPTGSEIMNDFAGEDQQ
jgi:hypothetical protein